MGGIDGQVYGEEVPTEILYALQFLVKELTKPKRERKVWRSNAK